MDPCLHQTGDDLSHMYLNGKREDSEDVDDWGRQQRHANQVAREGEEWGKLVQEKKKAEAKAARAAKKVTREVVYLCPYSMST